MGHLDGNALAGPLADLLGGDLTAMHAECAGCGTVSMIAELVVTLDGRDGIGRCPHCTSVMLVLHGLALDVRGIRVLRADPSA